MAAEGHGPGNLARQVAIRESRNLHENFTFRPHPVGVLLKETDCQCPPRLAATPQTTVRSLIANDAYS